MTALMVDDHELALQAAMEHYYDDPVGWVYFAFSWGEGDLAGFDGPDEWQIQQLQDVKDHIRTSPLAIYRDATASGHGIGKTAEVAFLILWFMSTRADANIVATANTATQLSTKTWRELKVWHNRLINKHWFKWTATKFYHIDYPETWVANAIPNSEHNSDSFQGLHGTNCMLLFDEASSIPDIIHEVCNGIKDPGFMWFQYGNPTRASGGFRDTFRHPEKWKLRHVDSRDCMLPNKEELAKDVLEHGEDSDYVRKRIRGVFPRTSDSQLIPEDDVLNAIKCELEPRVFANFDKVIGVDVAKGGGMGDRSVITKRQGPKVWKPEAYRDKKEGELAIEVYRVYREFDAKMVFVDTTGGYGTAVVQKLKELKVPVVEVVFSMNAVDTRSYFNMRTEIWCEMARWLKGTVDLPNCREYIEELPAIEYGYNGNLQQQLETKKDLISRIGVSPDYGDSLAVTFTNYSRAFISKPPLKVRSRTRRG